MYEKSLQLWQNKMTHFNWVKMNQELFKIDFQSTYYTLSMTKQLNDSLISFNGMSNSLGLFYT